MRPFAFILFRTLAYCWAGSAFAVAVWLLAAYIVSPSLSYFPTNAKEADAFSAGASRARFAAAIGIVRGDLWSEAAIAEAARGLFWPRSPDFAPSDAESALSAARHAASWSPHDSRVWLVLAGAQQLHDGKSSDTAVAELKQSFYTGPNEFALSPLRLTVAAGMTWDEELTQMLKTEITQVILKRPDLKDAIATAYQIAIPGTQKTLAAILNDADPNFLASVKTRPIGR
ncbi:hypothetical protein [Rhodoplanes sp. Z2-YC6860]|uniref:hypothetical protein n=1 Tax=Rhodoplanes sp. Z2-YC6860 TaxID=674703 RepID=UPI00078BD9A5|nr:hypothetical protein [Rhodoplanes sp. Z2-YC6860]AMN43772.1 hypothetical protein RHPLAN_53560 [Rhodoplanes sp. Z2-YC6860]